MCVGSYLPEERDRCSETGVSEGWTSGAVSVMGFSWQEVHTSGRVTDGERKLMLWKIYCLAKIREI